MNASWLITFSNSKLLPLPHCPRHMSVSAILEPMVVLLYVEGNSCN